MSRLLQVPPVSLFLQHDEGFGNGQASIGRAARGERFQGRTALRNAGGADGGKGGGGMQEDPGTPPAFAQLLGEDRGIDSSSWLPLPAERPHGAEPSPYEPEDSHKPSLLHLMEAKWRDPGSHTCRNAMPVLLCLAACRIRTIIARALQPPPWPVRTSPGAGVHIVGMCSAAMSFRNICPLRVCCSAVHAKYWLACCPHGQGSATWYVKGASGSPKRLGSAGAALRGSTLGAGCCQSMCVVQAYFD